MAAHLSQARNLTTEFDDVVDILRFGRKIFFYLFDRREIIDGKKIFLCSPILQLSLDIPRPRSDEKRRESILVVTVIVKKLRATRNPSR